MALLMVTTAAVNQLIIQTSQNVRRIEASNKAYMAAEAGIEDALYELSPHSAGYQTPDLSANDVRTIDFGTDVQWESNWEVESRSGLNDWSGQFYSGRKLIIFLFNDNNTNVVGDNEINDGPFNATDIVALSSVAGNLSITFALPDPSIINGLDNELRIDNDNDGRINEDSNDISDIGCGIDSFITSIEDEDCDGLVNEDNDEDAVILWKLTDGGSKSLIPLIGCLSDSIVNEEKSEICEKDFNINSNPDYSVTLNQTVTGRNEVGQTETIGQFITRATTVGAPFNGNLNSKLQFEFLIIAPMEYFDENNNKKIEIPYFDYEVNSSSNQLPYPFFRVKSDGYYNKFKQSLTSSFSPKTTVPLFDFTIIQQQ